MINKVTIFFLNSSTKLAVISLITVIVTVAILNWSQVLQSVELYAYDFNFLIRPLEATDERVVIVEWDEKSVRSLKETIISDHTLKILLEKIQQQKPRVIGLDLYRDLPVDSPQLSNQENIIARNSLQKFLATNNNLIGIEKVIRPTIYPPSALKKGNRTAASDIPLDEDGVIRRTYIYPQVSENGKAAGKPYIGIKLAYEYLKNEGWAAKKGENRSLLLFKDNDVISLKPLKSFIASPYYDKFSLNILVNWRKGKPSFERVKIDKVISNKVSSSLFTNKLVLIGNVSTATGDRHNLLLNQYNYTQTNGLELVAQVASSVISAALDKRLLINPVTKVIELLVVIAASGIFFSIIHKYRELRTIKLYLVTFISAMTISSLLFLCSVVIFSRGFWLPITNAIGSIWSLWFFSNFYLHREKENKRVILLEMFIRDLQHSLGNPLNSIVSSSNRISVLTDKLKDNLEQEDINNELKLTNQDNINSINTINKRLVNLKKQVSRIERYQKRTREFVNFAHLNNIDISGRVNISLFVAEIIEKVVEENEYDYAIKVTQNYDNSPKLKNVIIDKSAIEIVLENLLCNAFYSVSPLGKKDCEHIPSVKIETKLINRRIMFSVEDNGVGIANNLHQKIFEPFISFSYGQGIGLYLTAKILNLHNGDIKVESKLGEGSKFIFTIPLR